jgi:cell division protein FtsW (lipid II flippase)
MTTSETVAIASGPRLGRWLAWLCYVLIGMSLVILLSMAIEVSKIDWQRDKPAVVSQWLLASLLPRAASWACLTLAGFCLLFWRRPPGFRTALALIWLAPFMAIIHSSLHYGLDPDPLSAIGELLMRCLRGGVFHAAGCTAFLMGAPRIRAAYGIAVTPKQVAMPVTAAAWRPSWLGFLAVFLVLPSLALFPQIGQRLGGVAMDMMSVEAARQVVCLIVVVPLLTAAILLMKYRRWRHVRSVIVLLWLMLATHAIAMIVPHHGAERTPWHYAELLAFNFGFDLIAAYAWTAYLLTAPRVRELYPRPAEAVDVEAF